MMSMTNQNNRSANTAGFHLPDEVIDIRKILGHLYRYKLFIFSVSICTLFVAFLYTFTLQPQYKTTALIQIKSQSDNNVGSFNSLANNISNQASPTDTILALIRTRYILEPIVRENSLNVVVTPHYFPYFGAWKARHYQGADLAKPFLGLVPYVWGGERIEIKYFSVLPEMEGMTFRLVAKKAGDYQLYSPQGNLVLEGKVDKRASSKQYPGVILELTALRARPNTEFFISYRSTIATAEKLARSLQIKNIANNASQDTNQNTGIIQLELTGSNPKETEHVLNEIVNYVVSVNVKQKANEAQKILDFLHKKIPQIGDSLEKSETALNEYHARAETLSMTQEGQILIRQLMAIYGFLDDLKSQKEQLLQIYTPRYPLVVANAHQQTELEKKLKEIKAKIRNFPLANQKEINMTREIKVKNSMYLSLLANVLQSEINQAGIVGDVIALDMATPAGQLPLNKMSISLAGFFIGMILSIFAIIIKTALTKTVDDPDQLENELQVPVRTIVPYSKKQKQLEKTFQKQLKVSGSTFSTPLILAKLEPEDIAIESLRSLRVSLHINNSSTKDNTIVLMGSLSNIGKSFVSLNLAQVIADAGKRTLLIDADVRKGRLHQVLMKSKMNGLGEYLEGKFNFDKIIRTIPNSNLSFISCGLCSRHPTELFQGQQFQNLLQYAKQNFDQVIIDTPPVLVASDGVLIARHCDIKLFVVNAAKDELTNIKQAIKQVRSTGTDIDGFVLNHRQPVVSYGSRYYYNRYSYGAA